MTVLLRIYDNFTSNSVVSLGINLISTGVMLNRTFKSWSNTNHKTFALSACAGIFFALKANSFLIHNKEVKNKEEGNSLAATLSLPIAFFPVYEGYWYRQYYSDDIRHFFNHFGYKFCDYGFFNGMGSGFLTTILICRFMETSLKIKFRSPIEFL